MKRIKIKFSTPFLLVLLLVSIFVLFFTASISYKAFQAVTDSEKLVIHSHQIVHSFEELISVLKDAETGQRGFLLTKDSIFMKPYIASVNIIQEKMDNLNRLIVNDEHQQKNYDTLCLLINQRFVLLDSVLQENKTVTTNTVTNSSLLLAGRKKMDSIRLKNDEIIQNENLKLAKRQKKHANKTKISPITFLYSALFSLLVFVFAFFKICLDVKRLKFANNQLLINKKLFEHSENISNISNWCWNLEADSLTFSNNIYNLLSCQENEFEPTFKGYLRFVHPEDRHTVFEEAKRTKYGLDSSVIYYRVVRKDNEIRYFKSASKLIKDNFEKEIMIGVITDITEQYRDSRILEEKVFDLERTNNELTAFNHVASHDLQEPLRKIRTFISRIEGKEEEALSEDGQKYFSRIKFAAKRMQKLIDDLLTFSRTNKAEKAFELTDLDSLLENSLQDMTEIIAEKNATIIFSPLGTLSVIPFQMQQLFTNLISNALKYSKADIDPEITISAKIICGKEIIKSSYSSENKLCKITVSDNGIGFEQQYANEIFELFSRLHNKNEYSGNGIGLAICKKIVENHKGFIIAESTPGLGSIFTIFLPISGES